MALDDPAELARAAAAVAESPALLVTCHIGPDGDALGSMLGFAVAARAAGKRVEASFGEPFVVADPYRYLPLDLLVPPGEVDRSAPVAVAFDAGSLDRLGSLAPAFAEAEASIVVDHHASNTRFGTVNLIDPVAAASAEVAIRLIDELGWPIDEVAATCFHTGLVTDTGRFQYSNTAGVTLRTAARLVEAGARPEEIGRHVYEETPFGYLRCAGSVLTRAVLEPGHRLVWSVLRQSDLVEAGIELVDTDPLIDALRVARESDVAVLGKEMEDGRVKLSLRSRGRVDVGAIAVDLGGGGHHNASGFTHPGPIEAAIDEVRRRLPAPVPDSA
ncbi:MAG: bifunctional oligoribonuclease/PAP phosphatase NrnA [Acidimicrobiia bacterium]